MIKYYVFCGRGEEVYIITSVFIFMSILNKNTKIKIIRIEFIND